MAAIPRASAWALGALVLAACGAAPTRPASGWLADATAIAAGWDTVGRRAAVTARLDALGVAWRAEPVEDGARRGANLVADLGGPPAAPLLLIGAHLDRVDAGRGAIDNASGVAAALAIAEALRREPLVRHRVQLAFWDLEEVGAVGSRRWLAAAPERPALYANLDMFGYGDTVWASVLDDTGGLGAALAAAGAARGVAVRTDEPHPPSDHTAFRAAGVAAVSVMLVDGGEVAGIRAALAGQAPHPRPRLLRLVHGEADRPDAFDAAAVARALPVVLDALRRWDATAR